MCPAELGIQDLSQQSHPTTVVALWPGGDNLSHKSFRGTRLHSCSSFPLGHVSMKHFFSEADYASESFGKVHLWKYMQVQIH